MSKLTNYLLIGLVAILYTGIGIFLDNNSIIVHHAYWSLYGFVICSLIHNSIKNL